MNPLPLLLVLLISGMPAFGRHSEEAKPFATKADISTLGTVLEAFQMDCGRYPSTDEGLNALVSCPTNIPIQKWKGPYVKDAAPTSPWTPLDPWGHPYFYLYPGIHNTNGFDLYSCGQDGISKSQGGDLDDINNWDKASPHGGYDSFKASRPLRVSIALGFVAMVICFVWRAKANSQETASTSTRRKWEGILSLVWISPGFHAFEIFDIEWWRFTDSTVFALFIIFGAWWGFGILLAISGLKSGVRISVLASLGTALCFGFFLCGVVPRVST